jgi:hypothetical protein
MKGSPWSGTPGQRRGHSQARNAQTEFMHRRGQRDVGSDTRNRNRDAHTPTRDRHRKAQRDRQTMTQTKTDRQTPSASENWQSQPPWRPFCRTRVASCPRPALLAVRTGEPALQCNPDCGHGASRVQRNTQTYAMHTDTGRCSLRPAAACPPEPPPFSRLCAWWGRVGEENGVPVGGECLQPDTQRQRQHAKNAAGSKAVRPPHSRAGNVAPPVIIL